MLQAVQKIILAKQKILNPVQRILMVSFGILSLRFLIINNTYADESSNLNYSVTVEPALNITTSSNKVSLDLNPLNHDFDSQDLTVSVSTNNETGYKLYVNTEKTTNNPNGNKLIEKDDNSLYIETLASEVSEDDFISKIDYLNRWGYKLNTENYLPFVSGTLINSSKTQVENNSSTLTFAAKVGYETKAGTYALALNFQALANPKCNTTVEGTMQEFDPCPDLEDGATGTLTDIRDNATYTVRKINGNWWMTQNLRYVGDAGSPTGTMVMESDTTNIDEDKNLTYTDLTRGNSYDEARLHVATADQVPAGATYTATDMGVWYNYAAASAGTITGSSNTTDATYDICPRNWRLPTKDDFTSILNDSYSFSLSARGYYWSGAVRLIDRLAIFSTATSYDDTVRYGLYWDYDALEVTPGGWNYRADGEYVRCIRSN